MSKKISEIKTLDPKLLLNALVALKNGDFSTLLPENLEGIDQEIAHAFNEVVEQNREMEKNLKWLSNTVSHEGNMEERLPTNNVQGSWKNYSQYINTLIESLIRPLNDVTKVVLAVSKGDLTKKMVILNKKKPVKGEFLKTAKIVNSFVDQLHNFSQEVTRVSREVGIEGKLGGQAELQGVSGVWRELTNHVNVMANNLTTQVRAIAKVVTCVANGDLKQKLTFNAKGEIATLADTINLMIDTLDTFAAQVTNVAREVGTEGKLGGQAEVPGAAGIWRDLTDNVNNMASNLTSQVRNIAEVATAVARGDLSRKITVEAKGEILDLKDTLNTMMDQLNSFAAEVTRMAREVGTDGILGGQALVKGVAGVWKDLTDNVNSMANNLTTQVRGIARVVTGVANGDLKQKLEVEASGEIEELAKTINLMIDTLDTFAAQVTNVAREVGTEGKLGGQAEVPGAAGIWRDLTDNVNNMASNLTSQVRNIAEVATAVARGDLSRKITVEAKGEILDLKDTLNTMVDQLNSFAAEVTRMAREVGTDGILGGQALVKGIAGVWKDLTDNVNYMASNLTSQVRNIAEVATAVARGDLSRTITVEARGEILDLKDTLNTMVDQLNSFAAEVTRVAREVGTDGILGGQALVKGVAGVWKDLTDNVNSMAKNLTNQVRDIATVSTAVAQGDLSQKITVEVKGEILDLKNTINTMVDQLNSFAAEVTRVARDVGTEGKLGGQAEVKGTSGIWKELTDSVNVMANNLTTQVRAIAKVVTGVANGDLKQKLTFNAKGEIATLADTINLMIDTLDTFAAQVTNVAREVGTEGKLGGQAEVPNVAGIWKDLTNNVNNMASNLTSQVRNIAEVSTAVARGDLSKKITVEAKGEILNLKNTINTMVDQLNSFAAEVTRVARDVGTEGILGGQAEVPGVAGIWKNLTVNVNSMADNLTAQVRDIAEVAKAVAKGDLSLKITVKAKGEILDLKNTINTMVDQLNSFAAEVTRVAREVGTEGILGGQAEVPGVAGIWKKLTDSVNSMANNLTIQVRGIARVVTGVAKGDLKQKLMVEAKGEILALAETINAMSNTLAIFAEQVTTVAREVGVEGKLGGQAFVPGASGTWKDLTDNVNQLASNLTTQVRAIAEVATAVTNGDLTRTIDVEARGEVALLKDNINTMIRNLKETTRINTEQDWLKTNLAKFTSMLQGQKDLTTVARMILSKLAPLIKAQYAVFYIVEPDETRVVLRLLSSYAYKERKHVANRFSLGEGLVGQCAFEKERILLTHVPEDYIKISSGLGEGIPANIVVLPITFEGIVTAVIELASFERFSEIHLTFLEQLTESIGVVINTIAATMRTEELLKQSQSLAAKLQNQQEELKKTNEELEVKAQLLEKQKIEVEIKNREIEIAKFEMQEKAEQLSITSKYKSEFLANMSHELRTPLNSLLVLAKQLLDNPEGNLSSNQIEYAQIIHSSGNDLLLLINDILNLSKIESGTMDINITEVPLQSIKIFAEQNFSHIAQNKLIGFAVRLGSDLPEVILTDEQKLEQILKNLLSNAFKFTEKGNVSMEIAVAKSGWTSGHKILDHVEIVLAFSVKDSGIGIPRDKLNIIFEAFQQVDGATNRKYGGTGLGLSISRELTRLLGGEIRVESKLKTGSVFTLYIPQYYTSQSSKKTTTANLFQEKDINNHSLTTATHSSSYPIIPESSSPHNPNQENLILPNSFGDDRHQIKATDKLFLIVSNDKKLAQLLVELLHKNDCKGIIALDGQSGLAIAKKFKLHAILLSIHLQDITGWHLLDYFKHDLKTRYSPILTICNEEEALYALKKGAFSYQSPQANEKLISSSLTYIRSFLERKERNLLVVDDDEDDCFTICKLFENTDIHISKASTAKEASSMIKEKHFDCIIVDLILPDMTGLNLIKNIKKDPAFVHLPIVVYTGKELTEREEYLFRKMAHSIILKDFNSSGRLLSDVLMFLHYPESHLSEGKQQMLHKFRKSNAVLAGKKVLIVDDDIRNIFSVASVLEQHQMKVIYADNGKEGIHLIEEHNNLDIVLMDIMMPDIDGYTVIKTLREKDEYKDLPILAVTAKAMKEDREKCIEAGASDYISKPIDIDQLLSLIRVWLDWEELTPLLHIKK